MPEIKLDSPGMESVKALARIRNHTRVIVAETTRLLREEAREGAAQEGKLYAELAAAMKP